MSKSLKELIDERAKLVMDNRKIMDKAKSENRQLNTEESAEYDKRDSDIDKLCNEIDAKRADDKRRSRLNDYNDMLADSAGRQVLASAVDAMPTNAAGAHNPIKLSVSGNEIVLQPGTRQHERCQEKYLRDFNAYLTGQAIGEQLSLQTAIDPKGGYLAPPTFVAMLIKFLDDFVFMRQLATVLPPMSSAVSIGAPSWDTDPGDSDWTAEIPASDISEDDTATVGKREFKPNLITKLVTISQKLIRSSVLPIDSFLISRLGYKAGITEEKGFLTGSGAQQPLGVFTASADGIDTSRDTTASGTTSFTADDLINTKYSLKGPYQQRATWIFHRLVIKLIRKLKDGMGQYLWAPGLNNSMPDTILDRPFVMSEYAPSTMTTGLYAGVIGDFKTGYWICDSLELEIQRLVEVFARRNKVGFIARKETDGAPVLAECFARLKLA